MDNDEEIYEIQDAVQSPKLNELAKALSGLQGKMGKASKDKDNPFFSKKYADLESVWEAAREFLPEFGLAVVQTISGTAENPAVITTLLHGSGQWIRGRHEMKSRKPEDPQVCGSIITYGRRYGMAAILGIVQSDDDGNLGSKEVPGKKETPAKPTSAKTDKSPVKTPQKKGSQDDVPFGGASAKEDPTPIRKPLTKARQDQIVSQCEKLSEDQCQQFLKKMGVKDFSELGKLTNYTDAVKTIAELKNQS